MNCPVCSTTLVANDRGGIEIDHCPQCRGVWLDRGELEKLIARAAQPFTPGAYIPPGQGGSSYGPTGQGGQSSHSGGYSSHTGGGSYSPGQGGYSPGQGGYSSGHGHSSGHHGSHSHGHKPHKKHDSFLEQVFDIFD